MIGPDLAVFGLDCYQAVLFNLGQFKVRFAQMYSFLVFSSFFFFLNIQFSVLIGHESICGQETMTQDDQVEK